MPGIWRATKAIAVAILAARSQKRCRCGLSTLMARCTMKPVSTSAVRRSPRRFMAWPMVCTG